MGRPNPQNLAKGGFPGNKGGTGRPKEEIRQRFREILAGAGMQRVEEIIDGDKEGDVLKAVDLCGKYGLGEAKVAIPEEVFETVIKVLRPYVGKVLDSEVLGEIDKAFKAELGG